LIVLIKIHARFVQRTDVFSSDPLH
jgi:hypothetical protein